MTLVLAALVVLAVTTVVVLALGLRCSSNLAQASSAAEELGRRAAESEGRISELEGERDSLSEQRREALESAARVGAERDRSERGRRAAEDSAAAATSRCDSLEASLALALAAAGVGAAGEGGTWELLLTRLERQWAEALGVGPGERGVLDSDPGDQVAQALGRELERVKEEVGVETSYVVSEHVEVADPTAFLLASGEVIAVLASGCEQVQAELNSGLVLLGKGWGGSMDDLHGAIRRATAAGLMIEPVDLVEGDLRLGLRSAS